MTKVYLIRHAKSEANVDLVYGTDSPLSKNGEKQAKLGAKRLHIAPDIVLSGTKKCQIQTAQIMFPEKYSYDSIKEFDEINFGYLEGKKISDEVREILIDNPLNIKRIYSGDNIWTRAKIAIEHIERLSRIHKDKSIAIITGKFLIQSIMCELVNGEINGLAWTGDFYLRNCDYYALDVGDYIETVTKKNIQIRVTRP